MENGAREGEGRCRCRAPRCKGKGTKGREDVGVYLRPESVYRRGEEGVQSSGGCGILCRELGALRGLRRRDGRLVYGKKDAKWLGFKYVYKRLMSYE